MGFYTLCLMLTTATHLDLGLLQIDANIVFLDAEVEKDIHMKQYPSFEVKRNEQKV